MSETIITPVEPAKQRRDLLRMFFGIGGLLSIGVGLLIVLNPVQSGTVVVAFVAILLGAYLVIAGLVSLGSMMFTAGMSTGQRVLNALLGLLHLIGGIFVFTNLQGAAVVLAAFLSVLIGVAWLVEAVLTFVLARHRQRKAWSIVYGVIGLLAGITMIVSPVLGAVTLWLLLGISLIVLGVAQVIRAITLK